MGFWRGSDNKEVAETIAHCGCRAFLRAASRDPALGVPSPTFTLVQDYATPSGTVHHFDLWRLDGPGGMTELGWDEARDDVVLVEWPEGATPLVRRTWVAGREAYGSAPAGCWSRGTRQAASSICGRRLRSFAL